MERLKNSAIIASPQAVHADCVVDATAKHWFISTDGTTNLLPPIGYGEGVSIDHVHAQIEIPQIVVIGVDSETITASTRYKIMIHPKEKEQGVKQNPFSYAYTTAAVLSGTAATDRYNVFYALAAKINAHVANRATAYVMYSIAFTLMQDAGGTGASAWGTAPASNTVTYGSSGTQETSAVTAQVGYVNITSGTIAGNDAAGTIWLFNISDVASWNTGVKTFTVTDTLTGTSEQIVCTTNAALTTGGGIAIVDDSGYFNYMTGRLGPNEVFEDGFSTSHTDITRLGRKEEGFGTTMLAAKPVWDNHGKDVIRGNADYLTVNGDFVAGTYYTRITINYKKKAQSSALLPGASFDNYCQQTYWAAQTNHYTPSAAVDDLITYLEGTAIAL